MEIVNPLSSYPIGTRVEDINGIPLRGIVEKQGIAFSAHGYRACLEEPGIDADVYGRMIRRRLRPLSRMTLDSAKRDYAKRDAGLFPRYFIIEPNASCNRKCVFCPITVTNRKGNMKWNDFLKLILECGQHDVYGISLYQLSEPMLWRGKSDYGIPIDIADMVTASKNIGGFKAVNISTNGDADNLHRLLECPVDDIYISIDGTTAEVYDQNRPSTKANDTGAFDRTIERVTEFLDKRAKQSPNGSWVRMQIINNALCAPQVLDFIRHWIQHPGVDDVFVKHLDGMNPWLGNAAVSKEESDAKMDKVRNMPCQHIYSIGSMVADGRYNSCCHDSLTELTTAGANVREMSFSDWWDGDFMTELRKEHEGGATRRPCVLCTERDPWL